MVFYSIWIRVGVPIELCIKLVVEVNYGNSGQIGNHDWRSDPLQIFI